LKEPAGMVRLGRGAGAGRGPEDFWCGSGRCNSGVGWVGHGVLLGPGARWSRLPSWVGGDGRTCGATGFGLPTADSLWRLDRRVACGRRQVVRSARLPVAERW